MEFAFLILILSSALFGHGFGYTSSSCRYNCGNNRSGCSCTTYCRYYGNCCYDYYDYCGYNPTTMQAQHHPFTAYNSCRYNCGNNLDACSCTSYCQYYGNCCYDYYDYCVNNQTEIPTSAVQYQHYSCWYNCGYHFGDCSCTSSCQYYGNCCHDYYEYCGASTISPARTTEEHTVTGSSADFGNCGGSHHGSGFFSSPYYPRNYHNNEHCVWQLSAPPGQTVFLSFLDLDLESCCSCDYVNVYDGPSTSSRLLEQLCYFKTSHMEFNSSSSYMTVLFRSNYNGVGRGFKAYFSSLLDQNTGSVNCSSDRMNIAIRNSYLDSLGISWQDLYLSDRSCRASPDNNYVTFNFPIQRCSTKRKTQDGHIIYTNNVQAAQLTAGEITWREKPFALSVSCVMERDSSVGILYEANEIKNVTIRGMGQFNITMAFYQSSSFYNPITKFPYEVTLNQQLYARVQLTRPDSSLHLLIDSCVASPNHYLSYHNYYLISNGCRRDSKVTIYRNGGSYFAQFSFRAFKFLHMHNQVFLRCHVFICADNDYNSRCRQGCRNRRKRSLSSDDHTEVITLGPITLKGSEEAVVLRKMEDGKGTVKQ